jgi:hypothetical protein
MLSQTLLISPPHGPMVLPTVMTLRPGKTGARFQLPAPSLAEGRLWEARPLLLSMLVSAAQVP